MERKEHDCCANCEFRDEKTSHCSEVLEPLRQEYGFEGPESIHVALNNYCLMFQPSEEYEAEEREAEKEMAAERKPQAPADPALWARQAGGQR